jgi:hypothetical protein
MPIGGKARLAANALFDAKNGSGAINTGASSYK